MHDACNLREIKRFFNGRIAAAHNGHRFAAIEEPVAGGTPRHAAALVLGFAFKTKVLGARARRNNERITRVRTHVAFQANRFFFEVRGVNDVKDDLGVKSLGLLKQVLHQLRALDAVDRTRPVVHFGGRHQLAALLHAGDQERLEIGAGGVDGGGVSRRTGADDNNRCVNALAHGCFLSNSC